MIEDRRAERRILSHPASKKVMRAQTQIPCCFSQKMNYLNLNESDEN